jgi:hypothetical protein
VKSGRRRCRLAASRHPGVPQHSQSRKTGRL